MANLSNINNKLIVTDGGNLLVNATANLATYGGITIDNFSDPSIAMKTTGTSGWLWTQYITSSGTNNFSMGVNQTTPYWCVKAGAGMDSPHLVVDAAGEVGIGITAPSEKLEVKSGSIFVNGEDNGIIVDSVSKRVGLMKYAGHEAVIARASTNDFGIVRCHTSDIFDGSSLTYDFYVSGTGNVGIGTTSPQAALTVAHDLSNGGDATGFRLNAASGTTSNTLFGGPVSSGDYAFFQSYKEGTSAGVRDLSLNPIGGNVGIGTDSPLQKLHLQEAGATSVYTEWSNNSRANNAYMGLTVAGQLIIQNNTSIKFDTGASYTERMRIDSSGLVTLASMSSNDTRQLTFMGDSNSTSGNGGAIGMFADETRITSNWYYKSGQQKYVAGNGQAVIGLNTGATDANSFIGFGVNGPAAAAGPTLRLKIDSAGSIAMGNFSPSGTPTGDYRSFEIGRQGNTITGSPFKSALYLSTNATITAGSTQFTYRHSSTPAIFQGMESNGDLTFSNATSGSAGGNISFTPRMRIFLDGDITMGQFVTTQAPANGILKIRTSGSTANVCYPLLYVGGSTHLATRQYGIGFDPEGYADRMKMFFGVDGMGNGYSFGDFVWNINTAVNNDTVTPADEKMRLDKGGDLKLKTGNLAITNTSKGILLGGTGTANQLRIYQHGTWAPQIYYQNATDQANATNSTQTGLYTRIGNMCMVQFRLIWTQASGTPAVDNIGIKNLPFGGNTTQAYAEVPCFLIGYTGGPSPRGNLVLTLPGANQTLALFNDANHVGNMGNAIGSGTKEMRFSFTYTTNG